jgi:hypothetical protein
VNDSPGWVPPGSAPSDRSPNSEEVTPAADDAFANTPPGEQQPTNWSAQQPPAATGQGWGGPTPPAGVPRQHGQPGGTQPAGWADHGSGWNQPPAAKPGVVPLRPLGVGELLDGAVTTMRAHWRTVLGISLTLAVIVQVVATVVTGIWLRDTSGMAALSRDPSPSADQIINATSGALSSSGVSAVVETLGTVLATAMLTIVVSRAVLGRTVSITEAWCDSRPQLPRLLGLLILVPLLVALATLVGAIPGTAVLLAGATAPGVALLLLGLLGGLAVGIWIWIRFSLSAPALMLEKQGVVTAMRRSAKLVRGSWWRVFGVQLLATILVVIISSVVQLPATFVGMLVGGHGISAFTSTAPVTGWGFLVVTGIGAVVASTIAFPIRAGVTALLYMDQRIRREALDLELARAAGVPGYGDQQSERPAPGS